MKLFRYIILSLMIMLVPQDTQSFGCFKICQDALNNLDLFHTCLNQCRNIPDIMVMGSLMTLTAGFVLCNKLRVSRLKKCVFVGCFTVSGLFLSKLIAINGFNNQYGTEYSYY